MATLVTSGYNARKKARNDKIKILFELSAMHSAAQDDTWSIHWACSTMPKRMFHHSFWWGPWGRLKMKCDDPVQRSWYCRYHPTSSCSIYIHLGRNTISFGKSENKGSVFLISWRDTLIVSMMCYSFQFLMVYRVTFFVNLVHQMGWSWQSWTEIDMNIK